MIIAYHAVIHVWYTVNHVYHVGESEFNEYVMLCNRILKKFFQIITPLVNLEFLTVLHVPNIPYLRMLNFKVYSDCCILSNDNCLLCSDHCILCSDHCLIGKSGVTKFDGILRTTQEFQLILLFKNHKRFIQELFENHFRITKDLICFRS